MPDSDLQIVIAELHAANDELHAALAELRSAYEQLRSAYEDTVATASVARDRQNSVLENISVRQQVHGDALLNLAQRTGATGAVQRLQDDGAHHTIIGGVSRSIDRTVVITAIVALAIIVLVAVVHGVPAGGVIAKVLGVFR